MCMPSCGYRTKQKQQNKYGNSAMHYAVYKGGSAALSPQTPWFHQAGRASGSCGVLNYWYALCGQRWPRIVVQMDAGLGVYLPVNKIQHVPCDVQLQTRDAWYAPASVP